MATLFQVTFNTQNFGMVDRMEVKEVGITVKDFRYWVELQRKKVKKELQTDASIVNMHIFRDQLDMEGVINNMNKIFD